MFMPVIIMGGSSAVSPIFLPMMMKIGVDPVHFGVFMIVNLMIGLITPPVGLCVYLVSKIADIPTMPIFRVAVPR
jgi:C4-dicarboxylate transporter DctM subunit